jgi:nonribosomal peptide synthetase DhbF
MSEQATRLFERASETSRLPLPVPRSGDGLLPLSPLQEQLWFLDRLAPGVRAYQVARVLRLIGRLDLGALDRALTDVVQRHEILRTVITVDDSGPVQKVLAEADARLVVEDLRALPADRREAEGEWLVQEAIRAPFDLERGPLLRLVLVRLDETTQLLALAIHHACCDAWSKPIFWRDLAAFYDAHVTGRQAELPDLPLQFGDFAAWQRRLVESPELQPHVDYWAERLRGLQPLELRSDRPRPAVPTYASDAVTTVLECETLNGLRGLAERSSTTPLAVLLAVFDAVLTRNTGQSEIVVGTAESGRPMPELAPLIGPFTNVLVLRTDLSGDPTFAELLARVKDTTSEAFEHRDVPFGHVVAAVRPDRDPSRNPLFQVGLQLLDASTSDTVALPALEGLDVEGVDVEVGAHPLELSLTATAGEEELILRMDYSTEVFGRPRVARLLAQVERVLRAVVEDDGLRLSDLPVLSDEERRLLMDEWGLGPVVEQPKAPLHVRIAERAATDPEAVAARSEGVELTYGELESRAELLARRLRESGVGREDMVAVALERDPDLLVAMLGVLKAGGAFVILDPEHPHRRLRFILDDTQARVVLTSSALAARLPEPEGWERLCVDVEGDWLPADPEAPLEELADERSLAYVLYTSGSTGQPKGVLVEHHALTTFTLFLGREFGFGPGDRFAQHMAPIFDFAIGEIFVALTIGATLVFVPEAERVDPVALGEFLARERITYLGGPPAVLGAIARELPDLHLALLGGEALPGEVANRWQREGRCVVNGYGPTEAAVGCIRFHCEGRHWKGSPPIGRPMPRRYAYILDRFDRLCPVGVPGELVIGGLDGAGLARGYLNQPELTAERFVDDPLREGGRFYRTGDLAVWNEEGQMEFLGRIDAQVKLNGLRIELEEIESVLQLHPEVAAAAVSVQEGPSMKHLVGYVVSADGELDPAGLRSFLSDELPHYMIPSRFVQLEQLPLTPVGKIDRAALPQSAADGGEGEQPKHVPPRTPTERRVAAVFAQILERERIGAQDDFFGLGGTSLQAARAVLQLRRALGVEIAVRDFYAAPRVADVAHAIEHARVQQEDGASDLEAAPQVQEPTLGPRADQSP